MVGGGSGPTLTDWTWCHGGVPVLCAINTCRCCGAMVALLG